MITINSRLKELRKEKGLTQGEVAAKLGITIGAYSFYELAKVQPNIEALIILSNLFNVSIDYLVGKTNIRNQNELYDLIVSSSPEVQDLIKKMIEVIIHTNSKNTSNNASKPQNDSKR